MLVLLVVLLVGGALFMNKFLPSFLSGMIEGDVSMNLGLPYLVGTGQASILAKDAVTISAPVTAELTSSFWLAVVTAGLGIGTRFYHSKVIEKQEPSEEETEEKSEEEETEEELIESKEEYSEDSED